ncbi:Zn-dependent exopeptidase [Lanmaoa asiatica]|nr:Zn-dependent exopeptidase [Lanmaoa asiatica]
MDLKSDKGAEPTLPDVATTHRRPRPTCFRKLLTRVGIALFLFYLYESFQSVYSFQIAHKIKAWKHSCSNGNKFIDNYINRIEDAFLSVPSRISNPVTDKYGNSRYYATHPHLAGSPEDLQDAKDILSFFQNEFSIFSSSVEPIFDAGSPESREATLSTTSKLKSPNAWIDVYYPVMNTGNADGISLEIVGQDGESIWTADLLEDGDPGDKTAAKYKHAIPSWHGLSAAGEAAGPIVYANYGTKDDYDKLVATGVDLTGKIVLARYGAIFRGLKIKGAEDLGAVGILIYTDPRDDGAVVAENGYLPYPAGPARNPTSIQRGSVQYLSLYPGDPTTPGYPAYENATRVKGGNIPHIPSLPLSWANAKYLFEQELGGVAEGRKLDGKLGNHVVKMVNDVSTKVTPIWNAMAAIPGHIKDEVVIIGCHRDGRWFIWHGICLLRPLYVIAWVMGAADPTSGTVSLLEVVRGLGALVRRGWKPLRTLIIASWDAEEYGLIGSTEWGEDFAQWIQTHTVSYVNVDVSVAGSRYTASGSPSLAHLIKRSAQDVAHPTDSSKTVWDALHDSGAYTGKQDADFASMWAAMNHSRARAASKDDVRQVSPLGSGSDYTVFLQRLGVSHRICILGGHSNTTQQVASSDQSFSSTPTDPPYHYHSIYDTQMWQEIYADPGFHRHVAVAKTLGLLTLRLSESIIVPLNTTEYALQLDSYVDTVEDLASGIATLPKFRRVREAISKLQHASAKLDVEKVEAEEVFRKAVHNLPRGRFGHRISRRIKNWINRYLAIGSPPFERDDADLKFPALHMLDTIGDITERDLCKSRKGSRRLCDLIMAAIRVKKVNQKLSLFERGFISEEGVKDREWFRHLGVAPGKYLGYGATTLPSLTEAILYEQNATLVEYEITRLTTLLTKLAHNIEP